LDGAVHAIAFAPPDAISGDFISTPLESATKAFEVSAFSLKALAEALLPLLEGQGTDGDSGSIVALDFDAQFAWPSYDWMGSRRQPWNRCRATLRATSARAA
jgi:enoyl ACP reductase